MTWSDHASCKGEPTSVFFPADGAGESSHGWDDRAKSICARCPVVAECFDEGMRTHSHGVWGGTTAQERRSLRRRQKWEPECGTRPGYQTHLRRNEEPCGACKEANRIYMVSKRRRVGVGS